jgi:hypothetical protein
MAGFDIPSNRNRSLDGGAVKRDCGKRTRFLLPVEVAKRQGTLDLNLEAGYYFPWNGLQERIIGFGAGHTFNKRFELDGEVYNDALLAARHDIRFRRAVQTARRIRFADDGGPRFQRECERQPEYTGYFGIRCC